MTPQSDTAAVSITRRREILREQNGERFNGVISTLTAEREAGLALTVGGSQLDDVRHFVDVGRMRSGAGEEQRDTGETPTDDPLLLHIHRDATTREITEEQPLIPERKTSYVRSVLGVRSVLRSVRSDARARMQGGCAEELAMRLDKDRLLKR